MRRGAETAPFPWDDVLRLALGALRWSPEQVWRATPRELALALGAGAARTGPPNAADLHRLIDLFPDG